MVLKIVVIISASVQDDPVMKVVNAKRRDLEDLKKKKCFAVSSLRWSSSSMICSHETYCKEEVPWPHLISQREIQRDK